MWHFVGAILIITKSKQDMVNHSLVAAYM